MPRHLKFFFLFHAILPYAGYSGPDHHRRTSIEKQRMLVKQAIFALAKIAPGNCGEIA
jgi:hypothetical protein